MSEQSAIKGLRCKHRRPLDTCSTCRIYVCGKCRRVVSWDNGAADGMPDACDDCWAKEHSLDRASTSTPAAVQVGPARDDARLAVAVLSYFTARPGGKCAACEAPAPDTSRESVGATCYPDCPVPLAREIAARLDAWPIKPAALRSPLPDQPPAHRLLSDGFRSTLEGVLLDTGITVAQSEAGAAAVVAEIARMLAPLPEQPGEVEALRAEVKSLRREAKDRVLAVLAEGRIADVIAERDEARAESEGHQAAGLRILLLWGKVMGLTPEAEQDPWAAPFVGALVKATGEARAEVARRELEALAFAADLREIDHSDCGPEEIRDLLTMEADANKAQIESLRAEVARLRAQGAEGAREIEVLRDDCRRLEEALRADDPRCVHCDKPAACFGRYETMTQDEFACDDCCGHACEDGHCVQLGMAKSRASQGQGQAPLPLERRQQTFRALAAEAPLSDLPRHLRDAAEVAWQQGDGLRPARLERAADVIEGQVPASTAPPPTPTDDGPVTLTRDRLLELAYEGIVAGRDTERYTEEWALEEASKIALSAALDTPASLWRPVTEADPALREAAQAIVDEVLGPCSKNYGYFGRLIGKVQALRSALAAPLPRGPADDQQAKCETCGRPAAVCLGGDSFLCAECCDLAEAEAKGRADDGAPAIAEPAKP